MAPDAEIVLGWEESVPNKTTTWALGEHPDVTLYELCPWTGYAMDGSDPLSALLDSVSASSSLTHTCPVGDQAGASKHARVTAAAQATVNLPFSNPASLAATYVDISLNLRGAGAAGVTASMTEPGGQVDDLSASGYLSTGAAYYVTDAVSSRGTRLVDLILYTDNAAQYPLPTGAFLLAVTGDATQPTTVDAFVSDEVSGFDLGVAWTGSAVTDESTLGIPSTADSCIAVAAHTCHPNTAQTPWFFDFPPGGQGQVRDYSPWGPRIDGAQKPDIAAPDNPWAAAPHDKMWGTTGPVLPSGSVAPFGGTSGAAPHVTGVAALLAQAGVKGDAARDAIRAGAIVDADTGTVPNKRYGFGRLSAAGAFGVAHDGEPPTLTLSAQPAFLKPGETATLTPVATDPDGAAADLEIKWDDGYDGTWDIPYGPVQPRTVTQATAGTQVYKARVRDATGRIAEAIAQVTWTDTMPGLDAGAGLDAQAPGLDASPAGIDASLPLADAAAIVAGDAQSTFADGGSAGPTGDAALLATDGGNASPGGGCGCGVTGVPNGLAVLLGALALPLLRRRRA